MKSSTQEAPKEKSPIKLLLMGPPGSRKTTFALQFPDVHVLDADKNLDGPELYLRKNGHANLSYTYDPIRYNDDNIPVPVEECYNRVIDKLKLFTVDEKYKSRRTVLLDSLSHVNEFIIRHVLQLQGKSRKTYEMEARDWSPFKSFAYILLVGALESTGKTVIATCHEVKITEPDDKNIMTQRVLGYEPFFQGKLGDTIGAFFTDVWRTEVRPAPGNTTITILQTMRTNKIEVLKNSLGMPAEIDITKGYSAVEPYLKGRV